jgi:hypothetical protein
LVALNILCPVQDAVVVELKGLPVVRTTQVAGVQEPHNGRVHTPNYPIQLWIPVKYNAMQAQLGGPVGPV